MSFGRRLALFFILIALVPTLALVGMLVIISEDARRGKADARLASGLETAIALYQGEESSAAKVADDLAADPELAVAVVGPGGPDRAELESFVQEATAAPGVVAVEVVGVDGEPLASAGPTDAIAFAELGLLREGARNANLRVSTQTAGGYAADVQRLTKRELVVTRGDETLTATVSGPAPGALETEVTVDFETRQGEFREGSWSSTPVTGKCSCCWARGRRAASWRSEERRSPCWSDSSHLGSSWPTRSPTR